MSGRRAVLLGLVLLYTVAVPVRAWACPVCFGEVDGPMADAVNNGIMVMLGIVVAVQFGFVAMFLGIWRRTRRLREERDRLTLIDGGVR